MVWLWFRYVFARFSLWFTGFLRLGSLDMHCRVTAATVGWNGLHGSSVQTRLSSREGPLTKGGAGGAVLFDEARQEYLFREAEKVAEGPERETKRAEIDTAYTRPIPTAAQLAAATDEQVGSAPLVPPQTPEPVATIP